MKGYTSRYLKTKYNDKKTEKNYKFVLVLSITWFIYSVLFNIFSYSIGMIFSGLYLLIFCFLDLRKKYYLIIFALPFAAIIKISESARSLMPFLYVIYITHTFIAKSKKINIADIPLFSAICFFQTLSLITFKSNFEEVISFLLNILFVKTCIVNFSDIEPELKPKYLKNSILLFSISMMLTIIVADLFPMIPYMILYEKQTLLASIHRFSGLNGDPNYYSQLVLAALALLIYLILNEKKRIHMLFEIGLSIYLIINGFRSISKSYALTFIFVLTAFFIYLFLRIHEKRKTVLVYFSFIIISITGIALSIFMINEVIIPLIQSRTDTADLFTGRTVIWKQYLIIFHNNPIVLLTGAGASNSEVLYANNFGKITAAHNAYIELLGDLGIVCIIILSIFLRDLFLCIKKIANSSISIFIMVFMITAFGLSLSSSDAIYVLLPMYIIALKRNG